MATGTTPYRNSSMRSLRMRLGGAVARSALVTTALLAVALPAAAQSGGAGGSTDRVTGYRCVDKQCSVMRLPDANCICIKQNPGEQRLSKLKLKCSTKEGGKWVACPIKPRYGISVD